MEKVREYKYDNLKFLLILLVVFGHLLEITKVNTLYKIIYLFHMPMFIYISGYFSKCTPKSIAKKIYIYVIWQTIYFFVYKYVVRDNIELNAILSPIKILWYIYALIFWELIILINPIRKIKLLNTRPLIVIVITFIISLLCGYVNKIGNQFALSRIITFFPYFLIGYYQKKNNFSILKIIKDSKFNKYKIITYLILGIISTIYFWFNINTKNERCLYGAFSYRNMGYNVFFKLMWIFSSLSIMFLLNNLIPDRKIKLISRNRKQYNKYIFSTWNNS